jgi:hypothetical protein
MGFNILIIPEQSKSLLTICLACILDRTVGQDSTLVDAVPVLEDQGGEEQEQEPGGQEAQGAAGRGQPHKPVWQWSHFSCFWNRNGQRYFMCTSVFVCIKRSKILKEFKASLCFRSLLLHKCSNKAGFCYIRHNSLQRGILQY